MADDTSNSSKSANENIDSTATPKTENDVCVAIEEGAPEKEIGGRGGPDPTRYGDWEKNGRCVDF